MYSLFLFSAIDDTCNRFLLKHYIAYPVIIEVRFSIGFECKKIKSTLTIFEKLKARLVYLSVLSYFILKNYGLNWAIGRTSKIKNESNSFPLMKRTFSFWVNFSRINNLKKMHPSLSYFSKVRSHKNQMCAKQNFSFFSMYNQISALDINICNIQGCTGI